MKPVFGTQHRPVHGAYLPYRYERKRYDRETNRMEVIEVNEGVAFIDLETIENLNEQGQWDSQFGTTLLINSPFEEQALVDGGYAVRETRGGVHGTEKTQILLDGLYEYIDKNRT